MNREKENQQAGRPSEEQGGQNEREQHSSPFKEPASMDENSTTNEEDADLEQARKEAMTERD